MGRGGDNEETKTCAGICGGMLLIVAIGLIGGSYKKLEYYEIGLLKQRTTQTVTKEKTWGPGGNHFVGPDYEFVTFPAHVIAEELMDLSGWTRSTGAEDGGTSAMLDVSFQYRLVKEELGLLFAKTNVNFKGFVKNIAIAAVKQETLMWNADDFLEKRGNIEKSMLARVDEALKKEANCYATSLQLRRIDFPQTYIKLKLDASIQSLKNDAEGFRKEAANTRAKTVTAVKKIDNEAKLALDLAKAEAELIVNKAKNGAIKLKQTARSDGLQNVSKALGITKQSHFVSLDYLITLADSTGLKTFVDFGTVLAKGK